MATFARTTTYRKLDHDSMVIVLPVDPSVKLREGDPCYWDSTAKVAKPIPARSGVDTDDDAIVAKYCGIAQATTPVGHHIRNGEQLGLTKMAFYIGDCIVKLVFAAGDAVDHFTKVFQGSGPAEAKANFAGETRTEALGNVVIDAEEFKVARSTFAEEEVSVLMRPSIFKTRSF